MLLQSCVERSGRAGDIILSLSLCSSESTSTESEGEIARGILGNVRPRHVPMSSGSSWSSEEDEEEGKAGVVDEERMRERRERWERREKRDEQRGGVSVRARKTNAIKS